MKKLSKRILSLMLAAVMAMPVILAMPFTASADDALSSHLRAQYFTDSNLTQDKVGSNNLESMNGGGMYWDSIGVKFPTGNKKPYYRVRLNNILSTVDYSNGFTIAFSAARSESSWQRYFELSTDAGFQSTGGTSYLYFATNGNSKARYNGGGETGNAATDDQGGWNNWVITIKDSNYQVYKNGNLTGSVSNDSKVNGDWFNAIKNNGYLLLGASSYSADAAFSGYMRNFRIYDTYVASSDVSSITPSMTTLNANGRSCVSNNGSRWSGGRVNVVNDGAKGAISAGLYRFDISSLPTTGYVDWASATFIIQSVSNATMSHQQLDFYCRNGADLNDYIVDGHYSVDWGEWSDGTVNFRNNLGLNVSNYIGTMQHKDLADNVAVTVDLTEALITARENGWSSIILVAVQRNISNNGGPWSDTWLYDPLINASVKSVSSNGTYEELTSAISEYEAKMQNAPYTNMKKAYDAYVLANRYADGMLYGEANYSASSVQNVINSLRVATGNMKPWTYRTGDFRRSADYTVNKADMLKGVTAGMNNEGTTQEGGFLVPNYSDYMENVLYAMGVGDQANNGDSWKRTAGIFGSAGTSIALEYGPIVFLYDGVTTPAMPISLKSWYSGWNDDWTAVWINGTSGVSITDCWHGHTGSREYQWNWYGDVYHTYDTNANPTGDSNSTYYYSTTLSYTGGNSGFNNNLRVFESIAWAGKNQSDAYNEATNSTHIYVVDYSGLRSKIAGKISTIKNVTAYKEGGMASLLGYMDKATDLDPNHYIMYYPGEQQNQSATEISGAETLANDIKSRENELNSATATADTDTYNKLKAEMRTAHATAPTGNSAKTDYDAGFDALNATYTKTSVNRFRSAYEMARWHFSVLNELPYSHGETPASGRLSELANSHHGLVQRADMTKLDNAYEKANALLLGLDGKAAQYDKASVESLMNAIEDGKAYNSAEARIDVAVTQQTDVNNAAQDILDAIDGLKVVTSEVPAADISAYESAVNTINNLDPDAYDSTASITSAINTANELVANTTTENYTDGTDSATINVVDSATTQQKVNDATSAILSALSRSIKQYTVTTDGVAETTFQNGTSTGDSTPYTATYGTTVICNSDDSNTAWYMEMQTASTHLSEQFQGYGKGLKIKVMGNMTIKAVKASSTTHRVMIIRDYDNDDRAPVQYVDYVDAGSTFTLPTAPAIAYYTFGGYEIDGTEYNAGAEITVDADTEIIAKYNVNSDASCAINATDVNNAASNVAVAYNNKVELQGGSGAYAWVEETEPNKFRPFFIGKNVSFFASESTNLKAVSVEQFNAYKFKLPVINLRKSGTVVSGTKTMFNAQLVAEDMDKVQEYGILIGTGNASAQNLIVENSGSHSDYRVIRAKSTRLVGANQFAIAVNNLPEGYIYRGYVIYDDGTSLQTVYTDVM